MAVPVSITSVRSKNRAFIRRILSKTYAEARLSLKQRKQEVASGLGVIFPAGQTCNHVGSHPQWGFTKEILCAFLDSSSWHSKF